MIKSLLLSFMVSALPMSAMASVAPDVEKMCTNLAKLSGIVAKSRDNGDIASDAYVSMTNAGVVDTIALAVVRIVYDSMPDKDPAMVASYTYLACIDAASQ